MSRLVVLYREPDDPGKFERAYRDTHLPLVGRIPGLQRVETSRVQRMLLGNPAVFLVAVLFFRDGAALKAALKTPEWAESGRNLASIGGVDLATMFILGDGEVIAATSEGSGS